MIHDDLTSEAGTTAGVGFVLGGSFQFKCQGSEIRLWILHKAYFATQTNRLHVCLQEQVRLPRVMCPYESKEHLKTKRSMSFQEFPCRN